MKRLTLYMMVIALLSLGAVTARAEEMPPAGAGAPEAAGAEPSGDGSFVETEEVAELPPMHYVLTPEHLAWLGARLVDIDGSTRAMEYGWPHSSLAGGFTVNYNPLPHRFDWELDWKNSNDYEAEGSYAYRDIVKLSYNGWALWHNLDHFRPQPTYVERNPDAKYGLSARDNRVFLRLKWPDRAFHAFFEYRQFDKQGSVQQRFNGASGKTSRSRDLDTTVRQYRAGLNGHLGPIEAEYEHRTKTLDRAGEFGLTDNFRYRGTVYAAKHNVVPEFEDHADVLKVHTDLTGSIVGSATFINGEKDNEHSRASVDYRRAYADLTLIPLKGLTVAFRYRYKELQDDAPAFVFDPTFPVPPAASKLRPTEDPMDSRSNRAEVSLSYSPAPSLTVKADYSLTNTKRYNAHGWDEALHFQSIPSVQNEHSVRVGVNARPTRGTTLRGSVGWAYNQDPAYPIKPKNAWSGRFDAGWIVMPGLDAGAHYRLARDENNTANMDAKRDNAGVSLSWTPAGKLTLSGGYDYFRNRAERDVQLLAGAFNGALPDSGEPPMPLDTVIYRDTAHVYYIGAGYRVREPLSLNAEVHQSFSRGMYRTGVSETFGAPFGYGTVSTTGTGGLTDMKIRETGGSVAAEYSPGKGLGGSLTYSVNEYDDLKDKPQDGPQDGTAHTVLVMLSMRW